MSATSVGRNTISGQQLIAYIERIEQLRQEKKELSETETAIFAEAKAAGFHPATMRTVIRRRAAKPSALQEAQDMLDMYLHACGMESETPLFRAVGLMSVDLAARDQVIDALSKFVPDNGEIIVKVGKEPVRLYRDKGGDVQVEDYVEPVFDSGGQTSGRKRRKKAAPVLPDVDEDGAFELGGTAYREDQPITMNPFPHDDKRRPRFDAGWRAASGTDGMGPDDE